MSHKNLQFSYKCFSFFDLYCVLLALNKNITFHGSDMDYSTCYDVVGLYENDDSLVVHTNKFGILCKQAYLPDRIRQRIFRNKKIRKFMYIFENIILNLYLQSIWIKYDQDFIYNKFYDLCSFFNTKFLPKTLIIKNCHVFHIGQINNEAIRLIIMHFFRTSAQSISISYNNKTVSSASTFTLGNNFILNDCAIGYQNFNKNVINIKIQLSEKSYLYVINQIDQICHNIKNIFTNLYIEIDLFFQTAYNFRLNELYLGYNSKLAGKKDGYCFKLRI